MQYRSLEKLDGRDLAPDSGCMRFSDPDGTRLRLYSVNRPACCNSQIFLTAAQHSGFRIDNSIPNGLGLWKIKAGQWMPKVSTQLAGVKSPP